MYSRIAYSRAQQTGLAAQEVEPDGKAALEISLLYKYTLKRLNAQGGQHGAR
jgi:chromosome partitioning protein